jgi:hypothetical protein
LSGSWPPMLRGVTASPSRSTADRHPQLYLSSRVLLASVSRGWRADFSLTASDASVISRILGSHEALESHL